MRILVIGASGTIGTAVTAALRGRGHEVLAASRRGRPSVDVERPETVAPLLPGVAAVVCCAVSGGLTPVAEGEDAAFEQGLAGKLLGQVRLVRLAARLLPDGGSVTLTGGTFTAPLPGAAFGALVNAGLTAFVEAAAPELPRGLRVNVVSPGWVRETTGDQGVPAAELALAYVRAVEEAGLTGRSLVVVGQT
ncbi:NAD(P)-dependent dehydrogenase (short-subunit alcohol dehydrogenase family) [Crossiella equi]|uniref:NAD(P)-dependent dehydrogenase (Short-subunit alcohol dehydrogenase family) n=2 Tax=Crossiella equi TaxID=130796 RepID=A0ABS5A9H8_9PSEU|nr:SDR family oxidoreductase [Crossiella equi]MBP2473233.1 NAD(P)-dependent dehydrogenase (short-subunit alcohol dehydrogenase family) [Crossiella equi]